jgi:hypothetical protein
VCKLQALFPEGQVTMLRSSLAAACFAGASAWPLLAMALVDAMTSPLEQAMRAASCGHSLQTVAWLGHCAACWAGVVLLAASGSWLLFEPRERQQRLAATA